jgi:hypothetical protein
MSVGVSDKRSQRKSPGQPDKLSLRIPHKNRGQRTEIRDQKSEVSEDQKSATAKKGSPSSVL